MIVELRGGIPSSGRVGDISAMTLGTVRVTSPKSPIVLRRVVVKSNMKGSAPLRSRRLPGRHLSSIL